MNRVLFVDDEIRILDGLRRMLYPLRDRCQMEFVTSAADGLSALARIQFDVIVTDARMPGMDGTEFLREAMKRQPEAIRIVLSGQSERESMLKSVATAHQYLSKPCDAECLKRTIESAFALRDRMFDPTLQRLVSSIETLPSSPTACLKLTAILKQATPSIEEAVRIIESDPAMTAKTLQAVYSSASGRSRNISTVAEAVAHIGVEVLRTLALSTGVFRAFEESTVPSFSIERFCTHSMATASLAHSLLAGKNASQLVLKSTFSAGALHDIGKLALATTRSAEYEETLRLASAKNITLWEAEREYFHTTHAEVGAYLLWLWAFPQSIVEAVGFHHEPSRCLPVEMGALAAVHAGNTLEQERRAEPGEAISSMDLEYLASAGLAPERDFAWQPV